MHLIREAESLADEKAGKLIPHILAYKEDLRAVILVHNYQRPELYRIADFIGDSLELSRKAAETKAEVIIFCGVKFMAETAKLLNPEKTVLLPEETATCSLADMITVKDVMKLRREHPDAAVVSYINTNADVKAASDICCTSANAVKIVNSLPHKKVIFIPDKNLGWYVQTKTDKEIILWDGYCSVHEYIRSGPLLQFRDSYPGSKIIAHPECSKEVLDAADYVCSTGGMAPAASKDPAKDFIIVTECGMIQKLREDVPGKNFHSLCNICSYMKEINMNSVLNSLLLKEHEVTVAPLIRQKAKMAITRMLSVN